MEGRSRLLRKYNGMCITVALETAKQRLTLLVARLMRHTRQEEAKRINALFIQEPSKVYFQLQWSYTPRAENEQNWESKTETEVSHNPQCSMDNKTAGPRRHQSSRHPKVGCKHGEGAAPFSDRIHTYWLKTHHCMNTQQHKLTSYSYMAGQHL